MRTAAGRAPHRVRTLVIGLLAGLLALTACAAGEPDSAEPTPRPVTTAESQLLAITRFLNFDAGSRAFSTTVRTSGTDVALTGWIDFVAQAGYAQARTDSGDDALLWTPTTAGIIPQPPDAAGYPTLPIPPFDDAAWTSRALDAEASALDALLLTIGSLGSDRPDNPLLVQQTGAMWLRDDDIDGTPVAVFAAPPSDEPMDADDPPITADTSPLRLWLDSDGLMRRAEVRLSDGWVTVDMPDEPAPSLELPEDADD